MHASFFLAALPVLALAAPNKPVVDDATTTAAPAVTKAPGHGKVKTSTVYATSVHTVTSCAPEVTSCPGRPGKPVVVTEVIPVSTTVCPADDDDDVPTKPTPVPGKPPVKDDDCETTISTSTCVHTATDGPKSWVATTYLPVTQTICPVKTWAPVPTHPAGGPGKPEHPAGHPEPTPVQGGPAPTGTGSWTKTTAAGQAVVTAGAAENIAALKMVGAAAFAALLL